MKYMTPIELVSEMKTGPRMALYLENLCNDPGAPQWAKDSAMIHAARLLRGSSYPDDFKDVLSDLFGTRSRGCKK